MSRISLVVVNPGGTVRTTELPPGGERPLRVALEARAVVSVQIDGAKLSLAQWTEGRQLSWRKRGRKLLLQVDGQTLAELDDFFASQGQDRADDPAIELFAEDGASELWTASALEAYLGKGSDLVFDGAWPRTSVPWSGADQGLHQPGRELGAEILTQRDWAASATSGSVVSAGLAAQSGTGGVGGVAFVLAGLAAAALTRAGGETQVSSLTFSVQGSIYAGPMASNPGGDMVVRAYDSAGAVVAESVVAADGSYTLLMRLTVRSAGDRAIVLKAFDKNLSNANVPTYWDEATEQIQAVPILLAVIHLTTGTSQCHITPVSTLAAMRAGVNASAPIAPSVEKIDQANDLLGDLLLSGSQILSTTPEPTIKADGRPNLQSNMFGVVLNQLSWIEKKLGLSTTAVLEHLLNSLSATDDLTGVQQDLSQALVDAWSVGQLSASSLNALHMGQAAKALTRSTVQKLPAYEIGLIAPGALAEVPAEVIGAMALTQVSALTALQAARLTPTQVSSLLPIQVAALSPSAVGALSTQAVGRLSAVQLAALSPTQVAALSSTQLGALSQQQVVALPLVALGALQPGQLLAIQSHLSVDQQSALQEIQAAQAITPAQAAQLSGTDIDAMSAAGVSGLSPAAVAQLGSGALQSLSNAQISALTGEQAAAFTASQIDQLSPGQIASLSLEALSELSAAAIASLDANQMAALTLVQLQALASTEVSVALQESNLALSSAGLLKLNSSSGAQTFVAQTHAAGKSGLGHFDVDASGHWTYTSDTALDALVKGQTVTDALVVRTTQGAVQLIVVTITGTNDEPTVSSAITSSSTERDPVATVNLLQGANDADAGEADALVLQNIRYQVDGGTPSGNLPAGLALSGYALSVYPSDSAMVGLAGGQTKVITVHYQIKDAQAAWVDQTATLSVAGLNDAPLISVNPVSANYINDGSVQSVFSGTVVDVVDGGQKVKGLKLSVAGVTGSGDERLTIDGTEVSLVNGVTGTTGAQAVVYGVSVSGSTASVTLSHATGLSAALAQTLVDGLAYRNVSVLGMSGHRVVTLTEISDSGSDHNSSALNWASTLQDALKPRVVSVSNNVSDVVKIGTGSVTYSYTFSESVSDLTGADFSVTHGSLQSVSGSGKNWSVVVSPDANVAGGKLKVVLSAAAVQDAVGNTNAQHTESTVRIDTVAPVVSIQTVAGNDIVNAAKKSAGVTIGGSSDAEVGQAVSVQWGGSTQSALVGSDGTWQTTFASGAVAADASTSTVYASVSDQVGNAAAQASRVLRIDTVAPVLSITAPLTDGASVAGDADAILNKAELDAVPSNGHFILIGASDAEAGQAVQVQLNAKTYSASVQAGTPSNSWSVQVPKADLLELVHGNSYSIAVTVSDSAGNPTTTDASLEVKLAPPDVPTVHLLNTHDTTPVITGSAKKQDPQQAGSYINLEAGDTLSVTIGGQSYTLTVGASSTPEGLTYSGGTWSLAVSTGLAQGRYDVGVSVNAVGYSAPKVDISSAEVVVKTDPPVLTLEPITDDGVINIAEHGGAIKVSGTVQDNIPGTSINTAVGRTLSLSLGAVSYSAVVQSNGSWEVTIAAGDVGALSGSSSYSAQASYSGVYGNTGSSTRSVALDLSAPAMPNAQLNSDTGASDAAYVTTDVRINAPTNTEAQASLAYRVTASGQASGAWSSSYSAPTQDGAYTVQVRQTDAAGNASAIQSLSFVRDTTAPSFDSASTQAVNENVASGSWVYTAAASDANGGLTYSLKTGASDDAAKFAIDAGSGQVSLLQVPDYESGKTGYSFTVVASDLAGNRAEQQVSLSVNDLNDHAPVFTSGASAAVAENVAITTVIYTAQTSDADGTSNNKNVTYALKPGAGDASALSIDAASGAVTFNSPPDVESGKTSYSFTVVATNAGTGATLSREKSVVIGVTDVNDNAPVFTSASTASVTENQATTTVVYVASTQDADSGSDNRHVVYTLAAGVGDAHLFNIHSTSGAVTLKERADSEGEHTSYSFTVVATNVSESGTLTTSWPVTVSVLDLNDNAPVFTSGASGSVQENDPIASVIYDANTFDQDATVANRSVVYSLAPGVDDQGLLTINSSTGEVTLKQSANYEGKNSYSFTVIATNQAISGAQTTAQSVTVDVVDLNDSAPVFTSGAAGTVAENQPAATVLYTAASSDADGTSENRQVIYSLKAGTGDVALLAIDGSSGEVTLKNSADFEGHKTSYSFTVVATNAGTGGTLSTEKAVTVSVTDVNDNAPVFTSGAVGTVAENAATTTVIYSAATSDADGSAANRAVVYSLKANTGDVSLLGIDSQTGQVTLNSSANYESKNSYSFTVVATNAGTGTTLSTEQAVVVSVTDLNDNAPIFSSGGTGTVEENAATASAIYTAVTLDADGTSSNTAVVYSLKANTDDEALLNIDSSSGVVTLKNSADFESGKTQYRFTVVATNAGAGATLTTEQAVSVDVTDSNEFAPVFSSGDTASLIENASTSTLIYQAVSTDADGSALNRAVVYSLAAGVGDAALFDIDGASGAVTLKAAPDYETHSSYSFTVVATNAGHGATRTAQRSVTVTSTDLNDNAPVFSSGGQGSVLENAATATAIYTAVTSDADGTLINRAVVYSLKANTGDVSLLGIDSQTGQVTLNSSANYESKNSYSFTVVATNAGSDVTKSTEQAVTVSVTNVNEAPTASSQTRTLLEDASLTLSLSDFGFQDVDGDSLSSVSFTALPSQGELRLNGSAITQVPSAVSAADITAGYLVYVPPSQVSGSDLASVSFLVIDNGGTANQGVNTSSTAASLTFNVTTVNDAPVRSGNLPALAPINGDSANSTAVSIGLGAVVYGPGGGADESAQTLTYSITQIPSFLTLWLSNGTTAVTTASTGLTLANLQGLKYKTVAGAHGTGVVAWTVTDSGSGTSPDVNMLSESLSVTVKALNQAPVNTLPSTPYSLDSGALVLTGLGVSDADSGAGVISTQLKVTHGTLDVAPGTGVTISGAGTATVTLSGTVVNVHNLLAGAGVTFNAGANHAASGAVLTMTTSDAGNTGVGGVQTDVDTIGIYPSNLASPPPILALGPMYLRQGLWGSGLGVVAGSQVVDSSMFLINDPANTVSSGLTVSITGGSDFGSSSTQDSYFFKRTAPTVAVTSFTLAEINAGDIRFYYSGNRTVPTFTARVSNGSGLSASVTSDMRFLTEGADGTGGVLLYGDGSGSGGQFGWNAANGTGGAGGGSNDSLTGSSASDVIFGDGSGGGEGSDWTSWSSYSKDTSAGGLAGSGSDVINAGAGNDIIFGDGFNGTDVTGVAKNSIWGGSYKGGPGGYGGGGGAAASGAASIGGGAGGNGTSTYSTNTTAGQVAGSANSVGLPTAGTAILSFDDSPDTLYTSGAGAGVNATSNPLTSGLGLMGVDGDANVVQAYLTSSTYNQVLADVSKSSGYDRRLFAQAMGNGADLIDAGAGDDWVMGGYGNDIITGGAGNDTLWGRGGGDWRFLDYKTDGSASGSEYAVFRFTDLPSGQSVTIGGLTLAAGSNLLAADVARAFQSLANGSVGRSVVGGSFRGTLSGWSSAAMNAESNMVVFTAATANTNVTDISYSFSSASILRDNDLFVWNADDVGTGAIDTIKDFSPWNGSSGDRLNLTALLGGSSQSTNPGDWIRVVNGQTVNGVSGSSSLVIDVDGPDSGTVEQVIALEGVDWSAYTLDQIYRSGVLVLTVNQAPALTSIATNPTFTESNRLGVQAAGVAMFSGTTISTNDDGQSVKGLRLTVSGLVDGDDENLVIDGSTIALGASRTGATAINGMSYSVSYSNGTSTVVLTQSSGLATSVANAMVNAIGYKNLSVDDPSPGQRTFTLTQVSDTGGTIKGGIDTTALNLASTVTVVATNDAPTLTVTALDPSFVEATGVGAQAAAVKVFSSANASAIEGAQSLKSLTFTLSGLVDGASERITVDGRAITLGASSTGKTTTNLLDYSVDISNGLATVVLSASGISSAVVNAVLNGISYQNTLTDTPTPGVRTFTLEQLVDTGGTVNGGLDTLALNLSSSVTVVGANDAPAVGLPSSNYAHNSGTRSLTGLSVSDADSAADTITVTLEVTNGVLSASSASVTVSGSGTAALTLAGSAANINSLLSAGGVSFTTGGTYSTVGSVLTMTVSDGGNNGVGGVLADTGSIGIYPSSVDSPPPILTLGQMLLRRGLSDSNLGVLGSNQYVTTDMFVVNDPLKSSASNLTITITGGAEFGASSTQDCYFYKKTAPTSAVTSFTLAEVQAGSIGFYYSGSSALPTFTATVSNTRKTSASVDSNVQFLAQGLDGTGGQIKFGDGSGRGGSGNYGTSSPNGVNGGGGADTLSGTASADVLFGDGSGGAGGRTSGVDGLGGGGDDTISAGSGDDIIFGDGFDADNFAGGYGGGGGGGVNAGSGSDSRAPGVGGIGAGDGGRVVNAWTPYAGENTSIGPVQLGQVKQGYNGGGGAGVAASTSDLTLGVSAYLTTSLYQRVLNDISKGANADGRPFGQVMGGGDDVIDAGAGDDWVMAGYGNDTITGGSGNDTMWGRGGAVDSSPPTDNDVYIWNSGNAGTGATDTIKDFTVWNGTAGDRLDITSLLVGYSASKNLSEWITLQSGVTINGVSGSSRMTIDIDGAGTGTARQVIEFEGTNLSAYSVGQLISAGIMRLAINSAPTLSATRIHPTFTETAQVGVQTAAVALFSGASVSTSDSGQSIKSIELQISGLVDGANEKILIDGTTIGLGANITNSPTTATNTMVYRVTLSGGTATITLTDAQGISASAAASLVNGIRYQNTDVDDPTAGARTVTLTRITDTGGTLNGGVDSTALSIASTVTVVATNDPPTLSATLSTKTFSEVAGSDNRANAVVISATVSVSDSEGSSQISSATVSITNARAGDELLFTDTAKIGGSYDSGTGVLTLSTISGQAPTNADYSAALRSVKFNNTLDTPDTTARTITFKATDINGANSTSFVTETVNVAATNDVPTLAGTLSAKTFTEMAGADTTANALVVNNTVSINDLDGASQINSATVTITNVKTGDVLLFTNTAKISGSYSSSTGVLTLSTISGQAPTNADFSAAMQAVRFNNTSDAPDTTARTIAFKATDKGGATSTTFLTETVNVVASNDVPVLTGTLSTKTFTEVNGADTAANAAVINSTVNLSDSDGSSQINSATVSITNVKSADALLFTNTAKISGSYDNSTGVLTLSAISGQTPSNADYGAALQSVRFNNTSDTPDTTARTITFTATDINGATSTTFVTETVNVVATNDVPTLAGTVSTKTFTEVDGADTGANAVLVNPSVTIADLDGSSQISTATVTITNPKTGDVLLFTNTSKISGSYNSATGVLTLSTIGGQTPTNADFSAALQSIGYNNTSDAPDTTARTITFKATDINGATSTTFVTETVNVVATNEVPTLTGTVSTKTFTEVDGADTGANAVLVNPSVTIADSDGSSQISTATVAITNSKTGDVLLFTNTSKISGSYNSTTGVLTLSTIGGQTPTNAEYSAALQSVRFNNTSDTPDTAARTITFKATDINGATSTTFVTETVNVGATNDVPTLSGTLSAKTFTEMAGADTGANASVVNNTVSVSDLDGSSQIDSATVSITNVKTGDVLLFTNTAKISGSYSSSTGVLTLNAISGQTPTNADFSAAMQAVQFNNTSDTPDTTARTLAFKATDASGATSTTFLTETVNLVAVNDPPTLTTTAISPGFTEAAGVAAQASAVALFSNTDFNLVEAGQNVKSLTFTVSGLADGANETVVVDGTSITLGANITNSPSTATQAMVYGVTLSGSTATVTLTKTAGISATLANALVNGLSYQNTSTDNPTAGNRVITITQVSDTGGTLNGGLDSSALNIASTVTVVPVNDAPTLTATALNGAFTEAAGLATQAASVSVFSSAAVGQIETGQGVKSLTFTVSGLIDGNHEKIVVDGTTIALGADGSGSAATANNQMDYAVTISAGTATVTLTRLQGITAAAAAALVNGIAYQNTMTDAPGAGDRTFTLTQVVDSGGSANSGADTSALTVSSRVTVVVTNDAPVASGSATLAEVAEDTLTPSGSSVQSLLSGNFNDSADRGTGASGDSTLIGAAIVANAASGTQGKWQYSINSGTSWSDLATTGLADATAFYLSANSMLRFLPVADYSGSPGALSVRLVESGGSSLTNASSINVSTNGGASRFSSATVSLGTSISAVNDAPVATGTVPSFTAVNEDSAVVTAVSLGLSTLAYGVGGGADESSQTLSARVTQIPSFMTLWKADGTSQVTTSTTLTVAELQGLKYKTVANGYGSGAIVWTITDSGSGVSPNASTVSQRLAVLVNGLGDAPVIDASVNLVLGPVAINAGNPSGPVGFLLASLLGGVSDTDANAVKGLAIVGNDTTKGILYYSTDNGVTWNAAGTVSDSQALLLANNSSTRVYVKPDASYTGSEVSVFTVRAWDTTSGTPGTKVNITATGGSTAFSSGTDTVSIVLTDITAPALDLDGTAAGVNYSFNAASAGSGYSVDNGASNLTAASLADGSNISSIQITLNSSDVPVVSGEQLGLGGVGIALSGAVPASVSLGGVNWGVSLASGVLTFTAPSGGTAASNAQALLRNLEYSYSSAPAGNRTLSWRATDLGGNVSEAAVTSISHDSAGPVVDLLGASAGLDYTATIVTTGNASTGVALSSNASLTEPNSIASVNVTVAGLLNGSSEKLSVGSTDLSADGSSLPVGVSDGTNTWNLSYSAGTFSFSIDGASASQAQTLISSLRYKNSAGTLTDGMRTFTVSATDAFGQTSASSAVATVLVNGGAPAVASSSSLVTSDSNGDGVYGDAFTVTFAEPVLSSNIKNAANWSVSNPALAIQSAGFSSSTGWVVTSANSTTGTLTINSSGNSRATFNGGGNTVGSLLQQVLNTVPGQSYSVSFTLASSSTGSVSVQAAALNGPSTLAYNTATTSSNSPTTFSLNFVALSANTLLQFRDTATTAGSDAWLDTLTVVTPASSTTGSLGSSPRIEALNAFMLGGVEYASQYRITSGSGSAYGTNSTLSIPNTAVVDITNTAAGVSGNQTFTMTDITPPAGLTAGDAAITTDNIISSAAGDATVTLTYNFTVSDATHSKVRYYLDGVELTGKMSTVSTPSTATSASLTMDRADWGSDGIKSLTARLEDSSGNLGPLSQSRPVTVDTQIMQGVASMVRTTGSNASATAGDVISVTFNEAVLLGTLPAAFGSTASAVAVGAVGGYSKTWNITLGGTGISLSGSTGSVSFAGVKDVGQNTGTLTASVPADVLAMPQITSLGNVTSDNVINSSEAAAQQTMNLELATVRAGDEIKLYRDGVPISFIVTVSGVDQEVSSYSLPVGVSSTTTLPIKLKTDTWGADGERVLTATIQRGGGTLFASDERHVYVAADLGHWSTANGNAIWFDPSTEISLSDGIWAASVGGLQTSAVNATRTPTLVRSSDGANYVSFNATVNVSSTAAVLQTSVPTSTLDMAGKTSFSIFNVQQRASTAGATQIFSLGVGSTEATGYINGYSSTFNWTRNAVRAYSANSTIALQPALVDVVTAVSGSGSDLTATDTSYINGKQSATATNNISSYAYSQSLAFGGNAALTYGVHVHDGSWTGDLILFNRAVTSLSARQEINTYLAIKYKTMGNAVTAPSSGVFNLSSSAAADTLIDDVLDRRTTGAIDDTALIAGNDWVNAGAGNDTLRIKDLQFRQIDGGAGTDKLALDGTYSGASAIVLADFVSNVRGDSASDSAGNARVAAAGFHSLLGIEQIDLRTHTGAQSLVVTAADVNQISETNALGVVLGANDSLSVDGFASSSATWGYFTPSDGAVYDQKWVGGSGSYTLYALGGSLPTLTAVSGTTGSDTLVGTSADETLSGGRGDDTLTGGAGVDIFRFNGGEIGSDTVTDFTKSQGDKLDLTGLLLNKGLDSSLSDSVSRYLSLSRVGGSSDMALRVDLDGEGNFTSPEQTIALSSAWGSSNLGEPGNTTQELSNLMTLIANRVIVA